jgi:hypothetical protein|tara:strand:+ start:93 stop:290 length:198 start_codon:yes stop_codon:yes gene_type:complete
MKYIVRIRATITKDIEVDAKDDAEASVLAWERFNLNDGTPFDAVWEDYEEETVAVLRFCNEEVTS